LGAGAATDADLLLVRQPRGAETKWLGLYHATRFTGLGAAFTAAAPVSVVALPSTGKLTLFNPGDQPLRLQVSQPFQRTVEVPPQAWVEATMQGDARVAEPAIFGR